MRHAEAGKPVIGICNGFQILCEAGLLPGALIRNESLQYRCQWVNLRVENADTTFSAACRPGQVLAIPISHGEGRYYADGETLARLEAERRVVFRYCDADGQATAAANPNGSARQHRRHHQRERQRPGHDAPSGARLRGAAGWRGRSLHLAVDPGGGSNKGVTHGRSGTVSGDLRSRLP